MRKEKSRDAARSRRSKENHEFYELAKLLPLPAAITSQLDFLDKASIIRLTISFLKLRQFSVNGHPPWAPDFTTLGSVNPYSSQSLTDYAEHYATRTPHDQPQRPTTSGSSTKTGASTAGEPTAAAVSYPASSSGVSAFATPPEPASYCQPPVGQSQAKSAASLFDIHQGTHILQSLDGFAFAIGRDGRFLYISETVSMYLGLSQVEMTGASVFDYTHQHDHQELANHLGLPYKAPELEGPQAGGETSLDCNPASVHSQYSAASNETMIEDYMVASSQNGRKRLKTLAGHQERVVYGRNGKRMVALGNLKQPVVKLEASEVMADDEANETSDQTIDCQTAEQEKGEPLVRQFCIRMKSTLTKRGCQHFKSSGYRVVHVIAHLRAYQSNDHGHLMDPLDDGPCPSANTSTTTATSGGSLKQHKRRGPKPQASAAKTGYQQQTAESCKLADQQVAGKTRPKIIGMVAVAIALPPPSINELRLESDTFVLRLGLDLRITHIEPKITELLHYPVEMLAGCSLYSLVHPADLEQVQRCHADLLRKGQMMSGYYRLLARDGGYLWLQTCATLICNNSLAAGQTPALPQSPISGQLPLGSDPSSTHVMAASISNNQQQQHYQNSNQKQLAYVQSAYGSEQPMGGHGANKSLGSPALSGHHQLASGHFDSSSSAGSSYQQDPDQCVIFVNYMITNVIEKDEILDVCQSQNYAPASLFQHTSSNSNNSSNSSQPSVTINPLSSCSSPCQLASPARRNHQQQEVSVIKSASKCSSSGPNGKKSLHHGAGSRRSAQDNNNKIPDQQSAYVGYQQTHGAAHGPHSALGLDSGASFGRHEPAGAWLSRHQQRNGAGHPQEVTNLDQYSSATNGSSSSISPSLYKVAFGLDTSGSNYHHHHTHQAAMYPAGYGGGAVSSQVMANPWDSTSAAVAAVAAATSNHLSSAGHNATMAAAHPAIANPYVSNLDLHHQHHHLANSHGGAGQSFASSSPVTAGGHHHGHSAHYHHQHETTTGGYYNYYNYYGNKFI